MKATGTVVSVRRVGPEGRGGNPANWPVVIGAREIPPPSSPRPWIGGEVVRNTDPFTLPALPPGEYRLELWRGSATWDGNHPGAPPIWEWGREASDFGPSNAVVFFEVAGQQPPAGPSGDQLAREGFALLGRAVDAWTANGVPRSRIEGTRAWRALQLR